MIDRRTIFLNAHRLVRPDRGRYGMKDTHQQAFTMALRQVGEEAGCPT